MHFNGLTTIFSSSSMITPEYRFINKKQDKFDTQVMYPNIDIKYYHWTKNRNEKHNKSIVTPWQLEITMTLLLFSMDLNNPGWPMLCDSTVWSVWCRAVLVLVPGVVSFVEDPRARLDWLQSNFIRKNIHPTSFVVGDRLTDSRRFLYENCGFFSIFIVKF